MKDESRSEREAWDRVKDMLGDRRMKLGRHWSYNIFNDPKRLAFVLSRYKFAAKMGTNGKRVLELGCSEGIGASILAEFASSYTGVDMDGSAIGAANLNWTDARMTFIEDDFLGKTYGEFDTVVSLDVVEHIVPSSERTFLSTVFGNIAEHGMGIIGTPNVTSEPYASAASRAGHVNLFDAERLKGAMGGMFHNVFLFGVNDEVVHTGFSPMAHYLICIGCNRKERPDD